MKTGRKRPDHIKIVPTCIGTPVEPVELSQKDLDSLEAFILLGSENDNLIIRSSDPNHSLGDIYVMLQLISRQIESILMDNDG